MHRLASLVTIAAALALAAALPSAAEAANGTVHFTSGDFSVGEGDGAATITVERSTGRGAGQVRYAIYHRSADYRLDYTPVRGRIDFADGQTQASFSVPIEDDGDVEGRETAVVGIYGAYPQAIAKPDRATLTIVDDDTVASDRDSLNPLGLDPPPPPGNPLDRRFAVHEPRAEPRRHRHQADPPPPAGRRPAAADDRRPARDEALRRLQRPARCRGRSVPRAGPGAAARLRPADRHVPPRARQLRRLRRHA